VVKARVWEVAVARRYGAEPIAVRVAVRVEVRVEVRDEVGRVEVEVPVEFCWRGRRYAVQGVIAQWVEAMPWWRGVPLQAAASGQCQVWRVEAVGHAGSAGVYELRRDPPCGQSGRDLGTWHLVRVLD
jgi:hypothetical protein